MTPFANHRCGKVRTDALLAFLCSTTYILQQRGWQSWIEVVVENSSSGRDLATAQYCGGKMVDRASNDLDEESQPSQKGTSWSAEDDERLLALVESLGDKDWCVIASSLKKHTPRQCRERYKNHVKPTLNKGAFLRSMCPSIAHQFHS